MVYPIPLSYHCLNSGTDAGHGFEGRFFFVWSRVFQISRKYEFGLCAVIINVHGASRYFHPEIMTMAHLLVIFKKT